MPFLCGSEIIPFRETEMVSFCGLGEMTDGTEEGIPDTEVERGIIPFRWTGISSGGVGHEFLVRDTDAVPEGIPGFWMKLGIISTRDLDEIRASRFCLD